MPEVESITNDNLIDYMKVSIEINAENFVEGVRPVHRDTTIGYAVGKTIEKWCIENEITTVASGFGRKGKEYILEVWFENEMDATAFKLRWS